MDKIVEMNAALKFEIPCRPKLRHNAARTLNRQTTRVVTEVSEFLDVGSTPRIDI